MKKVFSLFFVTVLLFSLAACAGTDLGAKTAPESSVPTESSGNDASPNTTGTPIDTTDDATEPTDKGAKVLVVYFSATGTTKGVAEKIAEAADADIVELVPAQPYSSTDLNYQNDGCRANQEQNDDSARPEIANSIDGWEHYDVVLIGHPIWWGKEPRILDTFLESYDFTGKMLANFCTSGGSGIDTATENLKSMTPNATWLSGRRFSASATAEDAREWLIAIGVIATETEDKEETMFYITANGKTFPAVFADNPSAEAFKALLSEGNITVDMHDYSNFEKVGELPRELPRSDEAITTQPGDVILYLGHQITVYYDTNSWDFTRLGRIENTTKTELLEAFGAENVTMTFSLTKSN